MQDKALNQTVVVQMSPSYEPIDEEAAKSENAAVLELVGWSQYKDLEGRTWFCSEETKQCSRQFPLFVLLTTEQKQTVHTLLAQRALRPASSHFLVSSANRHGPQHPSENSYCFEPSSAPAVQQRSSFPSPVPPSDNDCSWHQTSSWAGTPFSFIHNEFITLITTEERLREALKSLNESLFQSQDTDYELIHRVVTQRFNRGHLRVSCMVTPKKYVHMELACSRCHMYVAKEFDSMRATFTELQEVRAVLLSFISRCNR